MARTLELGAAAGWGSNRRHLASAGSTQQLALAAAAAGAPEGALFTADSQTAGRGRHGHVWVSPAGAGLYASVVLRPPGGVRHLLPLTLASALALADAVIEIAGVSPEIRWPNDLLLGGRKVCGILIEAEAGYAALGFGINLQARALPPALAPEATALDAHAPSPVAPEALLAAALDQLQSRCQACYRGESAAQLAEFERRSRYARGLPVRVGGEFTGVTDGLEPEGFLRVRLADGTLRVVTHGDVRPLA